MTYQRDRKSWLASVTLRFGTHSNRRKDRRSSIRSVELLEPRQLLATFAVTNLDAFGEGSLRRAIQLANQNEGMDAISFEVSGTIRTGRVALPVVTDPVAIDGTSAPGFDGTPRVTVNFAHQRGLVFGRGAEGSQLTSLAMIGAEGAGVTLQASRVTVAGNFIGLDADGRSGRGNSGDGIRILPSSRGNLIGNVDPVTGIDFFDASGVGMQPVSGWQGIRAWSAPGEFMITGTSSTNGLLYIGPISGTGGTSYAVNMPGAATTSVYGPDLLESGDIRLVGSYRTGDDQVLGFVYQGALNDLGNAGNYRTIAYPGAQFNYVHSTMERFAVGNADGPEGNLPIGTGHAFLYDLEQEMFLPDLVYPGSTSTTAYGIWHNGEASYTIAGGYTALGPGSEGSIAQGYLVDFNAVTGELTNWTSFEPPSGLIGVDLVTHFEGISGEESGVYTISADAVTLGSGDDGQGYWLTIRRNADGSFSQGDWIPLTYPGSSGITSANSVAGNQVIGIVIAESGTFSYQSTVNVGFHRSNVISGNGGNGISIIGSHENVIAMNQIGTDVSGTVAFGNGRNGILVTHGASGNMIGGEATGGNDPTAGVFVRPPQGNLISGNRGNGVLINGRATRNTLSGNFVGTDAGGSSALGNRLDGVAIVGAHGNALIGCEFQNSPFVYYNVLSGNGGNGLRITDANDTTVHANFMGIGADNATSVGNGRNGILVSGRSRNTQVGGVIPLGNVTSGNAWNGIEVRDRASGFVSFNTFAGIAAFGDAVPNGRNGILVTSVGGDNLIRTSIVGGNLGNGIEIGGWATGVQVTETGVGTNTRLDAAIPNGGSGIRISGHAHSNAIGGFQPSIEPRMTISGNLGYGVEVVGKARGNRIFNAAIGTDVMGNAPIGNGLGGVLLGPGTSGTIIGGEAARFQTVIRQNVGNGLTILDSRGNRVVGNGIEENTWFGLFAAGDVRGTVVAGNTIAGNGSGQVDVSSARGIVILP
ncbi:right-handed parallel beta-helix repeat-containing protein [Tautonia marina]|uniref:right-handed parallel beta-helix repeat-containing protein n=1 Tax=Tautonia marina TaxID=2653855 RepID=UPI00126112F2|nr:right-handed parallel beta-helix repeat-containing protein [Tautonia marina]